LKSTNDKGIPYQTPKTMELLQDIHNHADDINWNQAIECTVLANLADYILGSTAGAASKEFQKLQRKQTTQNQSGRRRFGLTTGPAL